MAESLPTSVSAFSHRRARADSTTSFTYYEEEEPEPEPSDLLEHPDEFRRTSISEGYVRRSISDIGDIGDLEFCVDDEDSADHEYQAAEDDYVLHRCSSTQSRNSVHARLLRRDSTATAASSRLDGRTSQKVYMANEDLTIAVAGFRTGTVGYPVYILLCVLSLGLAFLLFRWLPRWYVGLVGRPCPLRDCDWVVIENQWGELAIMTVQTQPYGRPVSSVFGLPEKMFSYGLDDDNDPLMENLRTLDYRYVRLCYHPLKDKFVLSTGWKDPEWTDIRLVRSGLDSDEKALREVIFGSNLIDIEQKPVGQLLVDEVGPPRPEKRPSWHGLTLPGSASILHFSDC